MKKLLVLNYLIAAGSCTDGWHSLALARSGGRQAGRQAASKLLLASQSARNAILTSVHEAVVVAVNGADHGRPVRLDPQDAGDIVALDELNRGGSSALAL